MQAKARGNVQAAVRGLVLLGRVTEAAQFAVEHGDLDAAAHALEGSGDAVAAAAVYSRAGEWEMAVLTLKEHGHLLEAGDIFAEQGEPVKAAELYEEAGQHERAAAAWRRAGELLRAATALEAAGQPEGATRLRAQWADEAREYVVAAQAWASLGEHDRSMHAWHKAKVPAAAARERILAGHEDAMAAAWFFDGGEFAAAAALFAQVGEQRRAAQAYYRAGDVRSCMSHLTAIEDFVDMARVWVALGRRGEARKALLKAGRSHPQYVIAQEMLAAANGEDGEVDAAYDGYTNLAELAIAAGKIDTDTRRWLVAASELMFGAGKPDRALVVLQRLDELDLMTPSLAAKVEDLKGHLQAERVDDVKQLSQTLHFPSTDRYQITQELGRGGYGIVYRGFDSVLERDVVIKMIANAALPGHVARRWFMREARVAARLNHPNIVTVHDLGEMEGQLFIAMEFVRGATLRQRLGGSLPLGVAQATPIIRQLLAALDHAHRADVVHRDIKLENVMMSADGIVKLMDFGFARAMDVPNQSAIIRGTRKYMSPEQSLGADVDHRTDIYAAGVLMFKLMTNHFPFEEGDILDHQRHTPPPDPCEVHPGVPRQMGDVILRALVKKREDRYQSVADLAADLGVPLKPM